MEDSKPIIFDDGLKEAFEHPLKKYPTLQKVFLADYENKNEEDVFSSKLLIPFCSVMYYLINKDAVVFEGFMEFVDDLGEIKSIPRLDSNEVFETLSQLSIHNALKVLERNNFTDGTYTELKESLEGGDKRRFVTALKDCNTTPISPILKVLNIPRMIIQKFDVLEYEVTKARFESDELLSKWAWYKARKLLQELFGNRIKTIGSNTIRVELPEEFEVKIQFDEEEEEVVDTEWVCFIYDLIFGLFSYIKGEGILDENAINVIEHIMKQPPFEERYQQHQDCWKDGGTNDEISAFITRHQDYFSDELVSEMKSSLNDNDSYEEAEVIEEPQSTPQIEEPAAEEVKEKVNRDEENDSVSSPKTKERWRLQKYLCRDPGLDKDSQLDYCKGFKKSIVEAGDAGDRALTKFIQYLADNKYIDNDKINKNSFAYALTGRGNFRKMKIITVRWHHKKDDTRKVPESVSVLLYISSNLFDSEKGKTYSQLFNVLDAGPNPCIKDGKDQSSAYYDKVSEDFEEYFNECFGQFTKDFDKNTPNK